MKTKLSLKVVISLLVGVFFISSCNNDDDTPVKPIVEITELGSGHDSHNDKVAFIGGHAHIEANITAEGLIQEIEIEVHQVNGSYEFNQVYNDEKYVGIKNTIFHEHFHIPAEAPVGEYHLHLIVTDRAGQTTSDKSVLNIEETVE